MLQAKLRTVLRIGIIFLAFAPVLSPQASPAIGDTKKMDGFVRKWNGKRWVLTCEDVTGRKLKACVARRSEEQEWADKEAASDAKRAAFLAESAEEFKKAQKKGELERQECGKVFLATSDKKVSDVTVQEAEKIRHCQENGWYKAPEAPKEK